MKNEPLDNKMRSFSKGKHRGKLKYFTQASVKSAVEWLKEQIHPNTLINGNKEKTTLICDVEYIIDLVNKAFPDLYPKEVKKK